VVRGQVIRRLADLRAEDEPERFDHHPPVIGPPSWTSPERSSSRSSATTYLFAYPYGLWNAAALPHLKAAGYRAAFQLTRQPPDPQCPLLTIRRVLVPSSWDNHTLLTRLTTS
jgi:hypothetical protein